MAAVAFLNGLFVWRFLPEPPRHHSGTRPARMKYTDPRILPFVIVGVLMFTGTALVQQTMGFRFQDMLGLSARENRAEVRLCDDAVGPPVRSSRSSQSCSASAYRRSRCCASRCRC
jgi:hypothetical protein